MTDHDLDLRLLAASAIAREAGKLAHDYFSRRDQLKIELKGMQDVVSIADRAVEDLIRARIGHAFPGDALVGEEGDDVAGDPGAGTWIIDPIDGTNNFLRGVPYWCVAIAYIEGKRPVIAATYDPVHDELFSARKGGGTHRDQTPVKVSDCTDPNRATIGATFTFKMAIDDYLALTGGILHAGADHRRMGSTALMMCHTADGRLDGCATRYCNAWDVIGGLLLVEEAGGVASDFLPGINFADPNAAYGCAPALAPLLAELAAQPAQRP